MWTNFDLGAVELQRRFDAFDADLEQQERSSALQATAGALSERDLVADLAEIGMESAAPIAPAPPAAQPPAADPPPADSTPADDRSEGPPAEGPPPELESVESMPRKETTGPSGPSSPV